MFVLQVNISTLLYYYYTRILPNDPFNNFIKLLDPFYAYYFTDDFLFYTRSSRLWTQLRTDTVCTDTLQPFYESERLGTKRVGMLPLRSLWIICPTSVLIYVIVIILRIVNRTLLVPFTITSNKRYWFQVFTVLSTDFKRHFLFCLYMFEQIAPAEIRYLSIKQNKKEEYEQK